MPQGSFTVAQLNHFFDAAGMQVRTAVDSARVWLRQPPSAVSRFQRAKPARRAVARKLPQTLVVPVPSPAPAYRRTFNILLDHPKFTDRYDDLILRYSRRYDLDPRLVKAIIAAESDFSQDAKSPSGALGLMQIMPRTAEALFQIPESQLPPNRLTNPAFNIMAGTAFLNELFRAAWKRYRMEGTNFRNSPAWLVQRVIAAYNAGTRFLFRNHWYRETRRYVRKVLLFYQSKVTKIPRLQDPKAPAPAPVASPVTDTSSFY